MFILCIFFFTGQKNCSIKDEDELAQIIGKYRMTSELHWVDFKGGLDNHMKQTVVKKDSYSSDSLDEFGDESNIPDTKKGKESFDKNYELDMNNDKSLSQSSSNISSVQDNTSVTSTYSFEIVEETEALQLDNITESVDIRISPCNSTVMSYNCSNNFYSEFSLVANVEVQIPDANENLEDTKNNNEIENEDIQHEAQNDNELVSNEGKCEMNEKLSEVQLININANDSVVIENKDILNGDACMEMKIQNKAQNIVVGTATQCDPATPKKTEYYANKIEITKQEKRIASSIEKKIAEEIKAMKEREEDLRIMRERLAKEMSEKAAANKTVNSDLPAQPKPEKVASPSPTPNCDVKPVIKKVTTEKIQNAYTKARVFAIKRKDIFVKNDIQEIIKSPSAITHQESPVEREIRIAKEREEELKREREQALKTKLEMDSFNSELSANETDVDSALSICSDSSFDSVTKLAPLFPRTVSPEISNSNGISVYSSSAGSICSLESLSQREKLNNGSHSVNGSINGLLLSPSPDSGNCKPGYPFTSPRAHTEKRNKSIDMERFISSKGKEIKFKGDSPIVGLPSYFEIKPPQIKKGEEMTCKRFITAAAKIQNELKEMQEREEQLK